ncbi:hypothetical protein Adt_31818 [Abeliophyllum distichum]|uniref:Uncharacterized protein n=1 Tax=Abeliophyllum distichum TaxID=126358 RepID=A0ABD1RF73_9LAMI
MPFSVEIGDKHVPSSGPFSTFKMECSSRHSGENRKNDSHADKWKKKVDSRTTMSKSVEKLASTEDALIEHLKSRSGPLLFEQCMQALNELGSFDKDENCECWDISFLREAKNWVGFTGCRSNHMKIK